MFGVKGAISGVDAHAHKSGGRQPAVGRIRACDGDPLLRTDYVSPRTFASRTTAGSRQPLLVRDVCSASKSDICDGRTNVHKSGGRQPAVARIRPCKGDPLLRTDYVSPRTFVSRATAGSRQPLLVHDVHSL